MLVADWPFPTAAQLGSSVRAQSIEREIKAKLPFPDRAHLTVEEGRIHLRISGEQQDRFTSARQIVSDVLVSIDTMPVMPSEVEEILTISSRERLKWTKDGRLKSAGTRTVKLRGRAKAVTFHVFEPQHIEDVLDRDLPSLWREEDAEATAEARRRAAGKAALTRAGKGKAKAAVARTKGSKREVKTPLSEWDTFEADGLLR